MDLTTILAAVQAGISLLTSIHVISPGPVTAVATSPAVTAVMGAYNSNPIMWLQGALNTLLGSGLSVDGKVGAKTNAAIDKGLALFLTPIEVSVVRPALTLLLSKF